MGWKEAIANPGEAIDALLKRNPAADKALETSRLQMAIDGNVLTDWVKEHGFGGVDDDRFKAAIEQTKTVYEFKTTPDMATYWDGSYLPSGDAAKLQ